MTRMHDYHLPKPDVLDEDRQFVVSQAEASLGQPYPSLPLSLYLAYTQSGDRAEFEARYFSRRQMLSTFVLAETLERKGRFLPAVMDGIWAILEESTWCLPAHNLRERDAAALPFPDPLDPIIDLFAAESGATLSVAAALLGDEFPSVVKERIEREVYERIVRPYLTKDFWWMARGRDPRPVNWSPWCTQNVLLSVFLTNTTDEERRKAFVTAQQTLAVYFRLFPDDGCCSEGAEYYHRSGVCLFFALSVMDQVSSGSLQDAWGNDKLRRMAEYIVSVHVARGYSFNWGDCSACPGPSGVREYLFGKAVRSDILVSFAREQLSVSTQEERLLSSESDLFGRYVALAESKEALSSVVKAKAATWIEYPSSGLFISRQGNLCVSVKASANGGSHQHNDGGSVTVFKDGKPLLIDIGVETYSRRTFSPDRYRIWGMRSLWHNVANPVGGEQTARGTTPRVGCDGKTISLDLTSLYPPMKGFSYHRIVDLSSGLLVTDRMEGADGVLSLMSQERPLVDGHVLVLGDLGTISLQGENSVSIEEIPITDTRLRRAWSGSIWRTLVSFRRAVRWTME